jgi:hypothetical protein
VAKEKFFNQESILWISISAENFLGKFLLPNYRQNSIQKHQLHTFIYDYLYWAFYLIWRYYEPINDHNIQTKEKFFYKLDQKFSAGSDS